MSLRSFLGRPFEETTAHQLIQNHRWHALCAATVLLVCLLLIPFSTLAAASDDDIAPGRVIVRFRSDRTAIQRTLVRSASTVQYMEQRTVANEQIWHVTPGHEREVANELSRDPNIDFAEPDRIRRQLLTPNDTYFADIQWNLPKIYAPAAWDVTTGNPRVIVAVIDSGFDATHPDRPANLILGCDYVAWRATISTTCPAVFTDPNGHGTHVTGIIGARQNNGTGISGLAPNVTILVIRTGDTNGVSFTSDVSSAIIEATDRGARVINLSLGGPSNMQSEHSAILYAQARNVLVVAAAGNEWEHGNEPLYPAALPGVIAVGAASYDDQRALYSNTGGYISLVAPGGSATSSSTTDPRLWILSLFPGRTYQYMAGTSQASPHVAAAAALVMSVQPTFSATNVGTILKVSAHPIGNPVPNTTFGYGFLDVLAALQSANAVVSVATAIPSATATTTPTITLTPTISPTPTITLTPTKTPLPILVPTIPAGWTRSWLPFGPR